ncbi:MAG TPA: lamin tail domain-containing protein [Candidatus Paceibacterota bacterium]|jgi:hypothetical protein|nr:lamin tail domain-containing protein [Candidatus Paceibacterota bacterium]
MIGRILRILIGAAILLLILMWLFSGGWHSVVNFVRTVPNPIDIIWGNATSTYQIHFPWEIQAPRGADISGLAQAGDTQLGGTSLSAPSGALYAHSSVDAASFGSPSPMRGQISLSADSAQESSARSEYVEITSQSGSAVSLSGWSLQSALSGVRVFLPQAASIVRLGGASNVSALVLKPGDTAIVSSGPSPIGISFRETRCTGYLAGVSGFEPPLQRSCPSATDLVPLSAENLQHYGSDCVDYARSIPACTVPRLASSLTPGCQAFIQYTFSYQGCVDERGADPDFTLPSWRVYLNSTSQFWDDRHEIIRLLDQNGLTVDAVSY